MTPSRAKAEDLQTASNRPLRRRLVLVHGKGGVGKTVVSQAIARNLAALGKKTLWVEFEHPLKTPGEFHEESSKLHLLNAAAGPSFEQYMGLKIGVPSVTKLFLRNRVINYLAEAAPGIHELVLIGKIWHERENYSHVVVDMPSTGYALAMFQSTRNFADLFRGGPIHRDAEAMLKTFGDPSMTSHVIVSLPEEMPLQESIELSDHLREFFPKNPAHFVLNRRFPKAHQDSDSQVAPSPDQWPTPVPDSAVDYAVKRSLLEEHNLRVWRSRDIPFIELGYVVPDQDVVPSLQDQLAQRSSF